MLSALVDNHRGAHPFRHFVLQTIVWTIGLAYLEHRANHRSKP